jgi:hypothetical protein
MRLGVLTFACFAVACGAKTGLLLPDVASAPDATDVVTLPDVCVERRLPIERFSAEVILVIDRSGSMIERTPSGMTRWRALVTALERALPVVDRELWLGLVQFPGMLTTENQCGAVPGVELSPRVGNTANVLAALGRTMPVGGTPTFDALRGAATYYRNTPPLGRLRGRYLVLATDGGPNCNPALSPMTCACTSPRGCAGMRGNLACLDDDRTVEQLERLARDGVRTFVIGVPGAEAQLPRTLQRMAIAGGAARTVPGEASYYRAEDVREFTTAFRTITTTLARCRYVTNPVSDASRLRVRVGATDVPHDTTRTNGWAWSSEPAGELALHGAACEAAQQAGVTVSLYEACLE